MKELRVALIGYGGIARTHNLAYRELKRMGYPVSLVAVCDKNIEQFKTKIRINLGNDDETLDEGVHTYTDVDDLLKNEEFDIADICLPSFLHKEYSVKMLSAGKSVLCEKPMALNAADCEEMVSCANRVGKHLMIAQCVRFTTAYLYLKKCVTERTFGKPRFAMLHRLIKYPAWGSWFASLEKCGGCIIDSHIHDLDVCRYVFGDPTAVNAVSFDDIPHCQRVNTHLIYPDLSVVINGAWDDTCATSFECGYHIKFDEASVIYDGKQITVYPKEGESYVASPTPVNEFVEEIRYFCDLVQSDGAVKNTENAPEDSLKSMILAETVKQSAIENGALISF
ncbi:MAG: Gfo/Idh/MocA family oxidoreductase [Clostridia bacterium]|nr:Gfo/Idh/MocA family oxidoreductase [Clostridia bacterium]